MIFRGAASSSSSRGAHRRDGWRESRPGLGAVENKIIRLEMEFSLLSLLLEASLSWMKPTKPASVSAQPTLDESRVHQQTRVGMAKMNSFRFALFSRRNLLLYFNI